MTKPTPRVANYFGAQRHAVEMGETWLEAEEFAYPHGGMTRRARVMCTNDAVFRVVKCGIPVTYSHIPAAARIKGRCVRGTVSVCSDNECFVFTPYTNEQP